MTDRTSRSAETRAKKVRKKHWQPPSALDAPEAEPGYKHRWIRSEVRGYDDRANMSKRIREGFEPVRAEAHPDFDAPVMDDGKHAGVIGVGGLVLAKVPDEIVEERTEYFQGKTAEQLQGVDNDLLRDSDPRMPLRPSDISMNTSVEFGRRQLDSD